MPNFCWGTVATLFVVLSVYCFFRVYRRARTRAIVLQAYRIAAHASRGRYLMWSFRADRLLLIKLQWITTGKLGRYSTREFMGRQLKLVRMSPGGGHIANLSGVGRKRKPYDNHRSRQFHRPWDPAG